MANPTAAKLVEMAAQCLELAAALKAQGETPAPSGDAPLPAAEIISQRPGLTAAWLRDHVKYVRGARQRRLYLLSDVDLVYRATPTEPRPPKKAASTDVNDPIERAISSGRMHRGGR